jgi:hypothetical protein
MTIFLISMKYTSFITKLQQIVATTAIAITLFAGTTVVNAETPTGTGAASAEQSNSGLTQSDTLSNPAPSQSTLETAPPTGPISIEMQMQTPMQAAVAPSPVYVLDIKRDCTQYDTNPVRNCTPAYNIAKNGDKFGRTTTVSFIAVFVNANADQVPVTGVSTDDFIGTKTGNLTATLSNVESINGSASDYRITFTNVSGTGDLRVQTSTSMTVKDAAGLDVSNSVNTDYNRNLWIISNPTLFDDGDITGGSIDLDFDQDMNTGVNVSQFTVYDDTMGGIVVPVTSLLQTGTKRITLITANTILDTHTVRVVYTPKTTVGIDTSIAENISIKTANTVIQGTPTAFELANRLATRAFTVIFSPFTGVTGIGSWTQATTEPNTKLIGDYTPGDVVTVTVNPIATLIQGSSANITGICTAGSTVTVTGSGFTPAVTTLPCVGGNATTPGTYTTPSLWSNAGTFTVSATATKGTAPTVLTNTATTTVTVQAPVTTTSGGGSGGGCMPGYPCSRAVTNTITPKVVENIAIPAKTAIRRIPANYADMIEKTVTKRTPAKNVVYNKAPACWNIYKYWKKGTQGREVRKIQKFLNDTQGERLTLDSKFGAATFAAVSRFQNKYAKEILDPWGLDYSTGYWYKSTSKFANDHVIGCKIPGVRLENGVWIK